MIVSQAKGMKGGIIGDDCQACYQTLWPKRNHRDSRERVQTTSDLATA